MNMEKRFIMTLISVCSYNPPSLRFGWEGGHSMNEINNNLKFYVLICIGEV